MLIKVNVLKLKELDLTANQYCLAYLIHYKKKEEFKIFKNLYKKELYFKEDIFKLVTNKYLIQPSEDPYKIVFDESTIEGIFDVDDANYGVLPKDDDNPSNDWDVFVSEFRTLFPSGVTSGGYYVRSSSKDCSNKLMKFMKEYPQYSREEILEATKAYVERYRRQGFKYMKTAGYFIMKDKSSVLSAECEIIKDGDSKSGGVFSSGI